MIQITGMEQRQTGHGLIISKLSGILDQTISTIHGIHLTQTVLVETLSGKCLLLLRQLPRQMFQCRSDLTFRKAQSLSVAHPVNTARCLCLPVKMRSQCKSILTDLFLYLMHHGFLLQIRQMQQI